MFHFGIIPEIKHSFLLPLWMYKYYIYLKIGIIEKRKEVFAMRFKLSIDYLIETVKRFPVAFLFSVVTTIVSIFFNHQEPIIYDEPFFRAAYVGFLVAVLAVIIYERFFSDQPQLFSIFLQAAAVGVSALVYFLAPETEQFWNTDYIIRINVILFFLLVCIAWLPTLKNPQLTFGEHFIILFKSFFITALFSFTLGVGMAFILGAWELLLSPVNTDFYADISSVILYLFAPLCMLSIQSPYFLPYKVQANKIDHTIHRTFDILLTKISIPLITILSIILLIYVALNFTTISSNELETILISYVVFGWVFLFLIHGIDRPYIRWFTLGFLGTLLIVSIFQFIRSIQYATDFGITHNRYFVLLFCIVSAIAVFLYRRWPNLIPVVVMAGLVLSLIPPIDALSVGARSQTELLTQTVENNEEILVDGILQPTSENVKTVSSLDAERILESATYLNDRNKLTELTFISEDFDAYTDLNALVARGDVDEGSEIVGYYLSLPQEEIQTFDISDGQYVVIFQLSRGLNNDETRNFTLADNNFEVTLDDNDTLVVENITANERIDFNLAQFSEYNQEGIYELRLEDATLNNETETFEASLIIEYISAFEGGSDGRFILLLTPR